ncbi:MAG: hypothetical protein GY802_12480 [Gammaproteobacteria bacterium]|nr:hypothetical protein [Gammaproteobacteria bacterium]
MLQRRRLEQRLKLSCLSNDAAGTRTALLDWGRARWPGQKMSGLNQIGSQVTSSELSAQLKRLDAALYSRHDGDWSGRELWLQVKALKRADRTKPQLRDNHLARLYPA